MAHQPNPSSDALGKLAALIERGLDRRNWSCEEAATRAKEIGFTNGFSTRNIQNYRFRRIKRVPTQGFVRKLAKLFGEDGDEWLQYTGLSSAPSLLIDRERIMNDQERLHAGDSVTLISSKPFLEATEREVFESVLRNLDRGIVYTYYFPSGDRSPYGTEAAESYARFRNDRVTKYRFSTTPLLFGYSVDPARFRFFSSLHTVVHFKSRLPGLTRAFVYIEVSPDEDSGMVQAWYPLADRVWSDIRSNLDAARSPIADVQFPVVALNPRLFKIGPDYIEWFKQEKSVARYNEVRPILGHAGEACLSTLKAEIATTRSNRGSLRYLDIGCGDGKLTHEIASFLAPNRKIAAFGLDVSPAQLRAAKATFRGSIAFIAYESTFESFQPDEQFDVITAIHSLYVVDETYVRRIFGLLAPRGVAFVWLARRQDNIVSSICDAVDSVLRPSQRRNAADDFERHAELAGLSPQIKTIRRSLTGLLDRNGIPTNNGRKLIEYCALESLRNGTAAWNAAVAALRDCATDEATHPLADGLIVIQRHG